MILDCLLAALIMLRLRVGHPLKLNVATSAVCQRENFKIRINILYSKSHYVQYIVLYRHTSSESQMKKLDAIKRLKVGRRRVYLTLMVPDVKVLQASFSPNQNLLVQVFRKLKHPVCPSGISWKRLPWSP